MFDEGFGGSALHLWIGMVLDQKSELITFADRFVELLLGFFTDEVG